MAFNDSLSDMLARIKNAHKANKTFTSCYKSRLNLNVLLKRRQEEKRIDKKTNIVILSGATAAATVAVVVAVLNN